ncbi:hypothetical protein [Aquimarina sp. 2201CG5-10]|uniref:hypothetical protein n=1 Tax=Aquimarina callyspongiae TaxID=3098150 RepID=UPI002AB3FA4B|nr:hypothetical protein [Aquimarina sp. 2201CG5-10]MDY8138724.1 hypothetical protein [Aquimarina sp. 2201CG5-10]
MIRIKYIMARIAVFAIIVGLTQCATSQKIDEAAPIEIKGAYFQNWVAGIQGGGSGVLIYIPVEEKSDVQLDYVYFNNKKINLERKPNEPAYVGRYTNPGEKRDLVMSGDSKEEFTNEPPKIEEKIPFELKENECIIAYTKSGKTGFFKLDKLPEKELQAYPMQRKQ